MLYLLKIGLSNCYRLENFCRLNIIRAPKLNRAFMVFQRGTLGLMRREMTKLPARHSTRSLGTHPRKTRVGRVTGH